jgi:predicted O-methyltransferase YrrM
MMRRAGGPARRAEEWTMNDANPPAEPTPPSPRRIMDLATGYWASMVLLTLDDLEVFTRIDQGVCTVADLAAVAGLDVRALRFLLDAGVNLGLLERDGERYRNGPEADAFLVAGRPAFLGGGLKYALDSYPVWGRLPAAVRSGEAQARTRRFVYAMHHRSKPTALGLGAGIDLSGCRRLLDVGGGSGAYSVMFCRRHPELRATLIDLPGVLEVTAEIVAAEGVADRIELRAGDYHRDPLGEGYDAVFLNGMLHRETAAACRALSERVHTAMAPGGRLFVTDVMLDETGHGPLFPTLFALNMLLTAPGGGAHSTADQIAWLEAAGFVDVAAAPLPHPATHTLISARRP